MLTQLFLQQTPCKHPIIILKDTPRDEASAMLEFAYTGEVNVAQELLPALLHTARAFRIKGLDKVESPVADSAAAAGKLGHSFDSINRSLEVLGKCHMKHLAQVKKMTRTRIRVSISSLFGPFSYCLNSSTNTSSDKN